MGIFLLILNQFIVLESPHALIEPSALRAAKAKTFEAILVYPISEGAPVPETPHALIDPSAFKADGSITAWGHSNLGGTTPASINLGISITRRRTCASRAGITPRLD
jgi:hypothetical protein